MRLTDITIRSLKAPTQGAIIFRDDMIPGFGVRVSEGGTKSFVLTHGPRRERETIGRVAKAILNPPQPRETLFFPALGKTTLFDGWSKSKPKLDRRSGVSDWVLHDLRRTFASNLASIGIQLPVIERLLNHISGSFSGIVGVYQRYDFFPQMQDAITRWEEHLQKLLKS